MKLEWLEDFIALNENQSFSKAAKVRFVTQPAFSRRIRALENWLGVHLIDRSIYSANFTPAGDEFLTYAQQSVTEIYNLRESLRSNIDSADNFTIKTQHSLTVSFIPQWLQALSPLISDSLVKVHALNLHEAVDSFISGSGNFLLCYASESTLKVLKRDDLESIQIGSDFLVPVSSKNSEGKVVHPVQLDKPLRLLRYPPKSFFGHLVQSQCIPQLSSNIDIKYVYENALAEALKASVLRDLGIAWLPSTLIADELATNQLAVLDSPFCTVPMTIRLYRFKTFQSESAMTFWKYLTELYN